MDHNGTGLSVASRHFAGAHRPLGAGPVVFHALAVGCVSLIYIISFNPSLVLIVGGMLMLPTYLTLGFSEAREAPLSLSPLSFYFFWYSIGLGISAIYAGIMVSSGDSLPFSTVRVAPEDVATGYIIYLVGSAALHAGLQGFRPRHIYKETARAFDLDSGIAPLAIMYAVGIVALLIPRWFTPLGSVSGDVQFASLAALSSFALTLPAELGLSTSAFVVMLGFGTAGLFVAELNSGSKALILYSLFPCFWLLWNRRLLRRWLVVFLAVAVLLSSAIFQVVSISRNTSREYTVGTPNIIRILHAFQEWRSSDSLASSTGQIDGFLSRQFDPTAVGFFVDQVRQSGLMMGQTMAYAAYAFIPRVLWSDKPDVTQGGWFTYYLGFADSPDSATTSTGETATGELYWNFGLAGVLAGMFVVGALLGGLWRMAGADPRQKPLRMLLYLLIMMNMPNMPEAITVLTSIAANFLVFSAAFRIAGIRDRHVGATAA